MARFLDPKADVTFKKVFGEHKNLVISLLNAMLPLDEGKQVESIEYLPPELVPRTPTGRNSIVDVRCEETGGRKFIVEMQMEWTPEFQQRVLFNASKAYVRQMRKGSKYHLLQPVYSLNFINDIFAPDLPGYYHYYHLVHYLHSDKVLDGLHLVFVELPKFKAKSLAEKKMQVLWLRFLTEIDENTRKVAKELRENPQVSEALDIVEESAFNDEDLAAYNGFWDRVSREATKKANMDRAFAERDAAVADRDAAVANLNAAVAKLDAAVADRDAAVAKADAAAAKADAAITKLLQTARMLKSRGFSDKDISAITGLDAAAISNLSKHSHASHSSLAATATSSTSA